MEKIQTKKKFNPLKSCVKIVGGAGIGFLTWLSYSVMKKDIMINEAMEEKYNYYNSPEGIESNPWGNFLDDSLQVAKDEYGFVPSNESLDTHSLMDEFGTTMLNSNNTDGFNFYLDSISQASKAVYNDTLSEIQDSVQATVQMDARPIGMIAAVGAWALLFGAPYVVNMIKNHKNKTALKENEK